MKKLLLVVVVVALALTLVPLALAGAPGGGGWKHGHAKFNLVGSFVAATPAVTPADPATDPTPPVPATITVKVKAGSHIKGMRGPTPVTFTLADGCKVWQLTDDGKVESSLDQLAATDTAADKVLLKGKITKADDGSKVYTVTSVRYIDRTPDEAPAPEPDPTTPPAAL